MATPRTSDLLARRYATLGQHSPLFYREPLELVSGEGVWLTDAQGRTYLDGYNNVPHVGHANPVVADAVSRQLRTLNLHTRYLNHVVVDYAEALLGTFSDRLDRLFLVNSGSEANELALRLARQHTGSTGVLVSDFSYHGNTTSLAELTTGLTVREPLGDHVRPVRIPDATGLSDAEAQQECALALAQVDDAIASLQAAGHGVSAALFDPLFSTEGLLAPPAGYVEGLAYRVRAAGGLVIADEVQSGFGRLGDSMWGHELFDLSPELVTLGKPMGNGHPVGGVVTTAELLDEFGRHNMYFNTFAGSPVSSAAGLAVLEVMANEGLMPRAHETGAFIASRLREMAAEHRLVASVRGHGLFFGLDLVHDDGAPAADATRALTEKMREKGVLISKIGRDDNVLKMRPPMVIEQNQAEILVDRLAESLAELTTIG
ncbi:aspartate aminotransferase family protein [Zhihengliuella halotolerans]|uniref:4-aminobutyrate aminotransferase-like enzyme n=1 Tax=Zhihengliuella halotolerans TaxID=370736 RepID=A0A4Q8AAF9_9MICC|nr:aminotransferase class III-fold pyridoxal phosphate-dependent enzyme [Zhihengliuella halotolerans]RZU60479.1 4-aminobutyrate aminotransferase-like enzyme [Zhihengliuella halotolerans]